MTPQPRPTRWRAGAAPRAGDASEAETPHVGCCRGRTRAERPRAGRAGGGGEPSRAPRENGKTRARVTATVHARVASGSRGDAWSPAFAKPFSRCRTHDQISPQAPSMLSLLAHDAFHLNLPMHCACLRAIPLYLVSPVVGASPVGAVSPASAGLSSAGFSSAGLSSAASSSLPALSFIFSIQSSPYP